MGSLKAKEMMMKPMMKPMMKQPEPTAENDQPHP